MGCAVRWRSRSSTAPDKRVSPRVPKGVSLEEAFGPAPVRFPRQRPCAAFRFAVGVARVLPAPQPVFCLWFARA
eukprot:8172888-Lingulodinium_polyedra.AAC.1